MVTRAIGVAAPAVLVGTAFAALFAALAFGGGAAPDLLLDPGPVVRYGLPAAKLLMNLGVAVTAGALVLSVFALSSREDAYTRALDVAAAGAGVWTVAGGAAALLTFSSL